MKEGREKQPFITVGCAFLCTSVYRESLERSTKKTDMPLNPLMLVLITDGTLETIYIQR